MNALVERALQRIRTTPPRLISSPPTQPRRAAVAILIRVVPAPNTPVPSSASTPIPTFSEFFDQEWVKHPLASPEVLFLHRETNGGSLNPNGTGTGSHDTATSAASSTTEAHVAFPGGRQEPTDESTLFTAMRTTWEELGLDLAEPCYTLIGQLDDREITTSLGKRLLMILSPFVFLQLTPAFPGKEEKMGQEDIVDPIESTTLHWTPLASLLLNPKWSSVTVDAASRLAPKHGFQVFKVLLRLFIGSMQFPAILLQDQKTKQEKPLKLWGLSLGMALDLMSYMILPEAQRNEHENGNGDHQVKTSKEKDAGLFKAPSPGPPSSRRPSPHLPTDFRMEYIAPSLASVFPSFSYPDVNFWIWVFGKRYRQVVRGWEASIRAGGTNDKRINWSGTALNSFYAAIRKALVVVIVARALAFLFGVSFALWWVFS